MKRSRAAKSAAPLRSQSLVVLLTSGTEDPIVSAIAEASGLLPGGTFLGTTASTPKGKAKVLKFLKLAKALAMEEGFSKLSSRELARRAEVGIYHVQYYFPSTEDLIESLLIYITAIYLSSGTKRRLATDTPEVELERRLRASVSDCMQPETAFFFLQLWSISLENPRYARVMDLIYARILSSAGVLISKINPALSADEVHMRAGRITATIEGLQVLFCRSRNDALATPEFLEMTVASLMQIAKA